MDIQIQRLNELPDMADMVCISRAEGFRFVERLWTDWRSGHNRFAQTGEALFGVIDAGKAVGIVGLNRDTFSVPERIARIRRLFVLPDLRRKGIGRALVNAAVFHAQRYFVELRANAPREAAGFYERVGFTSSVGLPQATHRLILD